MAERKAVNKYYPPDWDPRKGSVNKRVGQHPLRDRARKLSQGILVIRFELPYNIWCGGCGSHVGMGVRYNAEKSKVGNYYTTPIYKFRMKCHLCDNYFEIQTDPKNHDYVILSGARRKEQRWDPVANEQIVPEDKATQKKMAMDAMYKLEHGSDDVQKGQDKKKSLAELETSRFSMKDDYMLNRMARDKFRAEKKQIKSEAEADQAILDRGALDIELLDETEEDRSLAGLLKYSVTSSFEEKQKEKRRSIEQRPIFEPNAAQTHTATPSSSSSSSSSNIGSLDPKTDSSVQLKGRLSQVLKMSGKDPFKIDKSSTMVKTSHTKLPQLGIRIKSSRILKPDKYKGVKSHSVKSELRTLKKAVTIERGNILSKVCDFKAANTEQDAKSSKDLEMNTFENAVPEKTSCINKFSTLPVSNSSPSFIPQNLTCENPEGNSYKDRVRNISCNSTDLQPRSTSPSCDISSSTELSSAGLSATVISPVISSPSSRQNSSLMSLIQSYDDGNEDDESDRSDP